MCDVRKGCFKANKTDKIDYNFITDSFDFLALPLNLWKENIFVLVFEINLRPFSIWRNTLFLRQLNVIWNMLWALDGRWNKIVLATRLYIVNVIINCFTRKRNKLNVKRMDKKTGLWFLRSCLRFSTLLTQERRGHLLKSN